VAANIFPRDTTEKTVISLQPDISKKNTDRMSNPFTLGTLMLIVYSHYVIGTHTRLKS